MRGYFGIGIFHAKTPQNLGTLWRSAHAFGAAFIFTIGARFKPQASDTVNAWKSVPMYHFSTFDSLFAGLPHSCPLVGIELNGAAQDLTTFDHPERACYLLGAEDHGLPEKVMERCHDVIQIPGASACLNVASAGTVVMYDRVAKGLRTEL